MHDQTPLSADLLQPRVIRSNPFHFIRNIDYQQTGTIFRFTPWPPYGFYQLARPAQGGSNRLKRITAIRAHTLLRQDDGRAWMALAKRARTRGGGGLLNLCNICLSLLAESQPGSQSKHDNCLDIWQRFSIYSGSLAFIPST